MKSKDKIIFLFLVAFLLAEAFEKTFAAENKNEQNLIFEEFE